VKRAVLLPWRQHATSSDIFIFPVAQQITSSATAALSALGSWNFLPKERRKKVETQLSELVGKQQNSITRGRP